jgi:hypothetical protein
MNFSQETNSDHHGPRMTTILEFMPRRPRFATPIQRRGHRTPRSHCPVAQNKSAVTTPVMKHTFCVMSMSQYCDPPIPLPSSLGRSHSR